MHITELPVPFQKVNDAHIVFGFIPNMDEAISARPKTIPQELEWDRLAQLMHLDMLNAEQKAELDRLIKEENGAIATDMYRYVRAWSQSFRPSLDDKLKVMGWCLSQLLREPPSFIRT